jgi:hypothetical protein
VLKGATKLLNLDQLPNKSKQLLAEFFMQTPVYTFCKETRGRFKKQRAQSEFIYTVG